MPQSIPTVFGEFRLAAYLRPVQRIPTIASEPPCLLAMQLQLAVRVASAAGSPRWHNSSTQPSTEGIHYDMR